MGKRLGLGQNTPTVTPRSKAVITGDPSPLFSPQEQPLFPREADS